MSIPRSAGRQLADYNFALLDSPTAYIGGFVGVCFTDKLGNLSVFFGRDALLFISTAYLQTSIGVSPTERGGLAVFTPLCPAVCTTYGILMGLNPQNIGQSLRGVKGVLAGAIFILSRLLFGENMSGHFLDKITSLLTAT